MTRQIEIINREDSRTQRSVIVTCTEQCMISKGEGAEGVAIMGPSVTQVVPPGRSAIVTVNQGQAVVIDDAQPVELAAEPSSSNDYFESRLAQLEAEKANLQGGRDALADRCHALTEERDALARQVADHQRTIDALTAQASAAADAALGAMKVNSGLLAEPSQGESEPASEAMPASPGEPMAAGAPEPVDDLIQDADTIDPASAGPASTIK